MIHFKTLSGQLIFTISGRGVRIFRQDEDVYAECLSEAPVFIQSPIHAVKSHDHPATVYRLPSGNFIRIFKKFVWVNNNKYYKYNPHLYKSPFT